MSGNFIGTWWSFAPVRACAGTSTCTTSGSCLSPAETFKRVISKMRELRGGDWETTEVARLQEELGKADNIGLHGYIIVKLRNTEEPTLPVQFMRLDWGHNSFSAQVASSDEDFWKYVVEPPRAEEEASDVDKYGLTYLASVGVGDAVMGPVAAGAFASAAAAGGGALGLANAGFFATAAVAGGVGASAAATCIQQNLLSEYHAVGPTASMKCLIQAIIEKRDMPYDLVSWK